MCYAFARALLRKGCRFRKPSPWKSFPRNHMEGIASIGLFVVPTIAFQQLGHRRRQTAVAVTQNPTAEWLARQITEALPWDSAPKYLLRDNDGAFGLAFKARIRAMGSRDRSHSTFDEFLQNMRPIITKGELTFRSGRTLPARAQPSGSEILLRIRSLAGCTIGTLESSIWKRQVSFCSDRFGCVWWNRSMALSGLIDGPFQLRQYGFGVSFDSSQPSRLSPTIA
jgi:hypothetical protein